MRPETWTGIAAFLAGLTEEKFWIPKFEIFKTEFLSDRVWVWAAASRHWLSTKTVLRIVCRFAWFRGLGWAIVLSRIEQLDWAAEFFQLIAHQPQTVFDSSFVQCCSRSRLNRSLADFLDRRAKSCGYGDQVVRDHFVQGKVPTLEHSMANTLRHCLRKRSRSRSKSKLSFFFLLVALILSQKEQKSRQEPSPFSDNTPRNFLWFRSDVQFERLSESIFGTRSQTSTFRTENSEKRNAKLP